MTLPAFSRGLIVALLVTVAALGLYLIYPRFVEELEDRTLDLRFWVRGERDPGPEIAIVAIDEPSLAEIGRWPWPRSVQARLVEGIKARGARLIALDLFYSESESPEADGRLARGIQASGPVVIGMPLFVPMEDAEPVFGEASAGGPGEKAGHSVFLDRFAFLRVQNISVEKTFGIKKASESLPPVEPIGRAAAAIGHVYALPEPDGTLRREILALGFHDEFFPSFSLQAARMALGLPPDQMILRVGEGVRLGQRWIPTDEYGRLVIDYYGRERTFPYYSAAEVLAERLPRDAFQDKVVLVGTSALGTYDQKITPFSNNYPGVEKNATVLANIIQENFIRHSWVHKTLDMACIFLVGIGIGFPLSRLAGLRGTALTLVSLAAMLVWFQGMFVWQGWWLNAVIPIGTLLAVYTAVTAERFLFEERRAREVRAIFSNYVSPKIVAELVRRPESARLGGERREVTILFSDIRGFTAFSEAHQPEEVVGMLNEFLKTMTEVVFRWDGTLDKFVGDAIMVFWGAPVDQPHHAESAVRCALHMRRQMDGLQEKWRGEGRPVLDCGIGINTGEVLVGNTGVEGKKMDYTIIGDNVNLAARVEALTRSHNAPILITEYTHRKISTLIGNHAGRVRLGHLRLDPLPNVHIKGRTRPVTVYSVRSLPPEEASEGTSG